MSQKLFVAVQEAASMVGCGRSTFWARVKAGIYPAPVKHGGSTRWRVCDLQAIGQASPTTTASAPGAAAGIQHGYTQP